MPPACCTASKASSSACRVSASEAVTAAAARSSAFCFSVVSCSFSSVCSAVLRLSSALWAAESAALLASSAAFWALYRASSAASRAAAAFSTAPILREDYTQLRHFLRLALRWATERYASYHVWAVLPLDLEHPEACDDLCAQYLSAGLTLRGMRPMAGADQMLIFSAHGLVQWRDPLRRCHLADPALPRVLERGYAAADFGWGKNGLELVLRPV